MRSLADGDKVDDDKSKDDPENDDDFVSDDGAFINIISPPLKYYLNWDKKPKFSFIVLDFVGEIQKYEAVVFISVLLGMVACCLFSCLYKRIQMNFERRRRHLALESMLNPSIATNRNNVFRNSLVEVLGYMF